MVLQELKDRLSNADTQIYGKHIDTKKIPSYTGSKNTMLRSIVNDEKFTEKLASSGLSKGALATLTRILTDSYYVPAEGLDKGNIELTIDMIQGLSDTELRKLQCGSRRQHLGEQSVAILRAVVGVSA